MCKVCRELGTVGNLPCFLLCRWWSWQNLSWTPFSWYYTGLLCIGVVLCAQFRASCLSIVLCCAVLCCDVLCCIVLYVNLILTWRLPYGWQIVFAAGYQAIYNTDLRLGIEQIMTGQWGTSKNLVGAQHPIEVFTAFSACDPTCGNVLTPKTSSWRGLDPRFALCLWTQIQTQWPSSWWHQCFA